MRFLTAGGFLNSVNAKAFELVARMLAGKERLNISVQNIAGSTVIDCGVHSEGSLEAGLLVSKICMGGFAEVCFFNNTAFENQLFIKVSSSNPVLACLGSQYAGWRIKMNDFHAMASGPARALSRVEKELYERIQYEDKYHKAVIFLETDKIPPVNVVEYISGKCGINARNLYIIVARTSSLVGSVQISARVLETALHRLLYLDFPLNKIIEGEGVCPVPPVAASDKFAMGVTNDAIIFMGEVHFLVERLDDKLIEEVIEKTVSCSSKVYGKPFIEILEAVGFDFYKISPELFSPAKISIANRESGRVFEAGDLNWEAYKKSVSKYSS
ncbi:MAG: methenyltetrahydromethanopterin cyclohydrolase [Candidatus Odinarchaeum yellowstonii]|uniref:Methenyltetrahydromethanopterin cyclohydrolase n=1 Tax=Odinarchaeota yellowstonii (strain LCB_4) TaxID=1841599 RepID=A0AAF0D2L0_ODILC|nr:MAG: methenyltetrahydromethanopterin cyclohydrolase [Candidatus Odinarchaeum yellowstonii]